jgi:hypothetical protein
LQVSHKIPLFGEDLLKLLDDILTVYSGLMSIFVGVDWLQPHCGKTFAVTLCERALGRARQPFKFYISEDDPKGVPWLLLRMAYS